MTQPPLSAQKAMLSLCAGNIICSVGAGLPLAGQKSTPASASASMRSSICGGRLPSLASSVRSMSTAKSLMSDRPLSSV